MNGPGILQLLPLFVFFRKAVLKSQSQSRILKSLKLTEKNASFCDVSVNVKFNIYHPYNEALLR